jgi:hypothetical protein
LWVHDVYAYKLHFPIESKVILWPKKEKTIRTNPNKVQLFKLFKGKLWVDPQTLQQSTFSEH